MRVWIDADACLAATVTIPATHDIGQVEVRATQLCKSRAGGGLFTH